MLSDIDIINNSFNYVFKLYIFIFQLNIFFMYLFHTFTNFKSGVDSNHIYSDT